jgi:hypothetical protein
VLVVVLVAAVLVDSGSDSAEIATGQIYSTDDGDPIDVFYELDESGMGCMKVIGFVYGVGGGGHPSCFDPEELEKGGTYALVLPASAEMPALVVGVTPAGAIGATVGGIGRKTARAETRGRWFLASLEPADPSPSDLADLHVEFDP